MKFVFVLLFVTTYIFAQVPTEQDTIAAPLKDSIIVAKEKEISVQQQQPQEIKEYKSTQRAATLVEPPLQAQQPRTQAPSANVHMSTPLINMDIILDLYNKDIDFIVEYEGKAASNFTPYGNQQQGSGKSSGAESKTRPSEKDVSYIVADTVTVSEQKDMMQGTYTKEDTRYNRAMIYLHAAQKNFSDRRYDEALKDINKSISLAQNIAMAHSIKGSIHYMLRQVGEAKKSWERALELDPSLDNVRAL